MRHPAKIDITPLSGFYTASQNVTRGELMPYTKAEIADESVDRLELSVRTSAALRKRFGENVLVRELAMLSEAQILRLLRPYHKHSKIFVTDINAALAPYQLGLGTKWADFPPSKHSVVRNPKQMEDHIPSG